MKQLFLLSFILLTLGTQAQTIPNGDFENWTSGNPDYWATYNDLATLLGFVPALVTQESPAPSGNSYLKATSRFSFLAGENIPGVAILGNADLVNGIGSVGVPFTQTPAYFTGVFKHEMVSATDSMIIGCQLTKWDPLTNSQILVGGVVGYNFVNSVTNWTNFSYPIQYETTDTPDSLTIVIASIGADGAAVSVDNLGFSSNGVGIEAISLQQKNITIFPNPCKNMCYLDLSAIESELNEGVQIEIIDIKGELVACYTQVTQRLFSFNAENLNSGQYIVRISNSNFNLNKTLIKE